MLLYWCYLALPSDVLEWVRIGLDAWNEMLPMATFCISTPGTRVRRDLIWRCSSHLLPQWPFSSHFWHQVPTDTEGAGVWDSSLLCLGAESEQLSSWTLGLEVRTSQRAAWFISGLSCKTIYCKKKSSPYIPAKQTKVPGPQINPTREACLP